jgi:hypothetical protein
MPWTAELGGSVAVDRSGRTTTAIAPGVRPSASSGAASAVPGSNRPSPLPAVTRPADGYHRMQALRW